MAYTVNIATPPQPRPLLTDGVFLFLWGVRGSAELLKNERRVEKWFNWDFGNLDLVEEDLEHDLVEKTPGSEGIFGKFPLSQFMDDLEKTGLLDRLRLRGYQRFRPILERKDLFTERLRLLGKHIDHREELQLMDLKSHRASLESPWKERYRALGWDWVEMQDPTAHPSPYRPVLPGQKYPGLGMFRGLTRFMLTYVEQLDVQALTAIPLYFHNAVLYSESFSFLDAGFQGRFLAMCRDLLYEGLAPASWWVARQEVDIIDRATGCAQPFEWGAALIVRPLCEEMKVSLNSREYQEACQQAMDQVEFRRRSPDCEKS